MLAKFEVKNFKNFEDWFVFDLRNTKQYSFQSDTITNGVVNKALIYGPNGIGKSNLGFAMLDATLHLTEGAARYVNHNYKHYLPIGTGDVLAEFKYHFVFGEDEVCYEYGKSAWDSLVYESLTINDRLVLGVDRRTKATATIALKGAETLKKTVGESKISLVTYAKNNSILDGNHENNLFELFIKQIEGMGFFRTLEDGAWIGAFFYYSSLSKYIAEKNKLEDLQNFLNQAGIDCELDFIDVEDEPRLAIVRNGKKVALTKSGVISTGTVSLCFFYLRWQQLKDNPNISFVFIDEFDAFYHHELSRLVVESLSELNAQVILTTHNTTIISNDILRPDCYFLMGKDRIESLANRTSKELRSAHNIEKMYRAGAFSG